MQRLHALPPCVQTLSAARCHGAPARSKRPVVSAPTRSVTKSSKERFSLEEALRRDRERIERNKTLPWKERLAQLRVYPWKTFVVFMVVWSYAGLYAVPYLKGLKPGEVPTTTPAGHKLPEDVRSRMARTPDYTPLLRRSTTDANPLPSTNKDAPRY